MIEIWKDIKEFENNYEISSLKRIRNKLTGHIRNDKRNINVKINGKIKAFAINRLYNMYFRKIEELENEIWKDIRGYEGLFQVSNYGRIKNVKDNLIIGNSTKRYKIVKIKGKRFSIGTLVLRTWKPIENEKYYRVNYIDGNSSNFNINNLEWVLKQQKKQKKYKILKADIIPGEIWRDILELDNMYQISNKGRVKNKNTERLIRCSKNEIGITYQKKKYRFLISILLDTYFPTNELYQDIIMPVNGKYTYEISNKGNVRIKETKYLIKDKYVNGVNIKKLYNEYFIHENFEDEIWIQTYKFPNYLISNYGRVKNIHGNFIKPILCRSKNRYSIRLYNKKKYWTFPLGRLVLLSFYPPSDLSLTCNHIDFNPKNNHLSNLEWMSVEDNIRYSQFNDKKLIQKRKEKCKKIKYENIIFNTIHEAALYVFNKNDKNTRSGIYSCCENKKKTYYDRSFSYA